MVCVCVFQALHEQLAASVQEISNLIEPVAIAARSEASHLGHKVRDPILLAYLHYPHLSGFIPYSLIGNYIFSSKEINTNIKEITYLVSQRAKLFFYH